MSTDHVLPRPPYRIAIVGAGAIGGWIGATLASRLGHDVQLSALARGATLAALRVGGLRLEHSDARETQIDVRASDNAHELGEQDLVVLAVKSPALRQAVPALLPLLGPESRVLVAMNGVPWWFFDGLAGPCDGLRLDSVDPGGELAHLLPARRIIGSVVHAACKVTTPGVIRHVMGDGLILGSPYGGLDERVAGWVDIFRRAGFNATHSDRIQRDIWFKLWGNMTINPISALTGATADRILDDDLVRGFVTAVMREAGRIGDRIGCAVDQTPEQRHAVTRKLGAFKTSMLQDVEAGRPIELEALVGAVREIGRHLGIETPHTDALLGLTRLMAQTRGLA